MGIVLGVLCNVIVTLILFSGIFTATRNNWKVLITKLVLTLGGGVGAFFLTPVISNAIYGVEVVSSFLTEIHLSVGTINSCIFLLTFLIFYSIVLLVCNIVKHILVSSLHEKSENRAKARRARSINPKAERVAKKTAWKNLKAEYRAKDRLLKKIISGCIGGLVALLVGVVVLLPYKYLAVDVNYAGDKDFLKEGYSYTINGVIDNKIDFEIFDWLIHIESETEVEDPAEEVEDPEVTPDTESAGEAE